MVGAGEFHNTPSLGKRLEPFRVVSNAFTSQEIELLYTFANRRIVSCSGDEIQEWTSIGTAPPYQVVRPRRISPDTPAAR